MGMFLRKVIIKPALLAKTRTSPVISTIVPVTPNFPATNMTPKIRTREPFRLRRETRNLMVRGTPAIKAAPTPKQRLPKEIIPGSQK